MTQAYLYAPMGPWTAATWRCFLASLSDGLWVLSILSAGWLAFGRLRWYASPGWRGYLLMTACGIGIAIAVEWWALGTGRWSYSSRMPLLPGTSIGLVPAAQMILLPPLVFRLVRLARRMEPASRDGRSR